jgi:pimeloyl-ACP methyl ester carboxylesterase
MTWPPTFSAGHRGGSGTPMVCLHGFMETWRTWELVLPALEREHDVLAPTLLGHAGGPPARGGATGEDVIDAVERAMDEAGFGLAHLVGNSLGGYVALALAARGRARSVVALAPAGGWADGDDSFMSLSAEQERMHELAVAAAPHADAIAATPEGRRQAMRATVQDGASLPVELVAHMLRGVAGCTAAAGLAASARDGGWPLDAERIACPVRVIWGTEDRLLPWPSAAARYRRESLPHADWVELDGVGHAPQLDVPFEAAQLILGWTSR